MADIEALPAEPLAPSGMVTLTNVIYALHAFSVVTGIIGAATIVGAFLTGWPSIIAVILNYAKRSDVTGTYLASHFSWQIRTFWFALLWVAVAFLLGITIIGIPFALVIVAGAGLWVLYRIIRGWLALQERRPMPLSR
ncbi:MAG: hypothetical protein JNK68_12355 [Betaproteobacteria bacterium]|nr:hypothetical protein [Betaproteobacteria bacterium]